MALTGTIKTIKTLEATGEAGDIPAFMTYCATNGYEPCQSVSFDPPTVEGVIIMHGRAIKACPDEPMVTE